MNVTIVTPLRDAAAHWPGYVRRLLALDYDADKLRLVLVEGDSVDGTKALVQDWAEHWPGVKLVTCDTGASKYGSVVHPERFRTLATVFNAGLAAVDLAWSDCVMLLPVDIEYEPNLLRRLLWWGLDVVAPFVFMDSLFYDLWAFSQNGEFFGPFPEHMVSGREPIEMTTVGGTLLIHADVLRAGVRYGLAEVDRDFSRDAKAAGFRLWADPTTRVYHRR